MTLEYWFMFPTSIVVATTAMASGIEGATFFAPILMLFLGLPPEIAIGVGLITEVFGFASGLYAYHRKQLIDYHLGSSLLIATIPFALLGTWLSGIMNVDILKIILGVGLLAIAIHFLRVSPEEKTEVKIFVPDGSVTHLITATGEKIYYKVCNRTEGRIFAGIGSLFMGMIATGLGEMNSLYLLRRCHVPASVAVATNVFVVAVTALVASTGHVFHFIQTGGDSIMIVLSLVTFTVPGVIIGGQFGSAIAGSIPQRLLEQGLAILFILVAFLMLIDAIL